MADDFTEDGQIEQLKVSKVIIKLREFLPFIPIHLVFIFYWYKFYIWLLEQNEDTWSSSISGSDTGGDVCDVDDEELDRSELFIKVLQSFPPSSLPAHSNSSLVGVVKEILGHHFYKL